jgi:hypothetical protein
MHLVAPRRGRQGLAGLYPSRRKSVRHRLICLPELLAKLAAKSQPEQESAREPE